MYKCIIIDDEERSINNLTKYIEQFNALEVVKSYSQPLEALKEISQMEKVDLIFMDVDMPLLNGVELSKMIRHKTERLIFTTAYSKYAFDAYESQAEAYLLKPFSFAKFAEALTRLLPPKKDHLSSIKTPETSDYPEPSDYILVKKKDEQNSLVKIDFKDIIVFESYGNYVKIFSTVHKDPIISYLTLKDVLSVLAEKNNPFFLQVHRAFIISIKHFKSIEGNMIKMTNGIDVQTGGYFRSALKRLVERDLVTTSRRKK